MKKVKDLMTENSLEHCSLETTLHVAAKKMKESNKGALPIVDKQNKVIGIVTDRDICLSLASKDEKEIPKLKVKDAITKIKVHTVMPDDNITKALKEMRQNKIGRLPVTDKEGKLKGMLSVNNLLSSSINKKEEIGHITSEEENLAKTIKSLFERNNAAPSSSKSVQDFESIYL